MFSLVSLSVPSSSGITFQRLALPFLNYPFCLSVPSSSGITFQPLYSIGATSPLSPFSSLLVGNHFSTIYAMLYISITQTFQFPPRRESLFNADQLWVRIGSFQFPPRRESLFNVLRGFPFLRIFFPFSSLLVGNHFSTYRRQGIRSTPSAAFSSLLVGNHFSTFNASGTDTAITFFQFPPRRESLFNLRRGALTGPQLVTFSSLLVGNHFSTLVV